jgi:hypothetical protein
MTEETKASLKRNQMEMILAYSNYKVLVVAFLFSFGVCKGQSEYDSLKKYSYLLIGAEWKPKTLTEQPNELNLHPLGYGTGFFVRWNDSLLFITAYHVLTTFDVYKGIKPDSKIDYWLIRYRDTLNVVHAHAVSIFTLKDMGIPYFFLNSPDIFILNLTGYFNIAKINSIEQFFIQKPVRKKTKEKIISYGYPADSLSKYSSLANYNDFVEPSLYEGKIGDSNNIEPSLRNLNIDSMYLTITPNQAQGTSGAPVFKEVTSKRKKWIEFVGVQSGSNSFYKASFVVKKEELFKRINQPSVKSKK